MIFRVICYKATTVFQSNLQSAWCLSLQSRQHQQLGAGLENATKIVVLAANGYNRWAEVCHAVAYQDVAV